jgi:acyl carrier protein
MKEEEFIATLREILSRQKGLKVDPASLTPQTRLDEMGFDSLSLLEFLYDVEERFRVETQLSEVVTLTQVGELVDLLRSKVNR